MLLRELEPRLAFLLAESLLVLLASVFLEEDTLELLACVFLEEETLELAAAWLRGADLVAALLLLGEVVLLDLAGVALSVRFSLFLTTVAVVFLIDLLDLVVTVRSAVLFPILAVVEFDELLRVLGVSVTVLLLLVLNASLFLTFLEVDLVCTAVVFLPDVLVVLATLLPRSFLVT